MNEGDALVNKQRGTSRCTQLLLLYHLYRPAARSTGRTCPLCKPTRTRGLAALFWK